MTMLSPVATYHAELREQLGSVGRALSIQRGILWLARGLALGSLVVLGVVIWAWVRDVVSSLPFALLIGVPILAALLTALGSLFVRHNTLDLARRVDRAASLHERSTTALELGAKGDEYPLAVAQMRDAVEHLRRVDLLEAFPPRLPRNELLASFFTVVIAIIVGVSPNPWLLSARASNPAITTAREEAQRVQRLADSIQPQDSAELNALHQLVSQGAKSIDSHSNEPDSALSAVQDLEEQLRQMSAGDDQLAAALAAISAGLSSDPATQQLASAINTGDMRQIAQASKDLAQATAGMSSQDQQRVAKVLRDAAAQADRESQSVSSDLSAAADALQNASAGAASDSSGSQGQAGQQTAAGAQSGQSASDALNQLAGSAAAAGERERTAAQLESSRNALERALGRTQSRAGSTAGSSNSNSSSGNSSGDQSGQGSNGAQGGDSAQGSGQGQGQPGDQGGAGPAANGSGSQGGGDQSSGGDSGQGGGYSTGGQNQNNTGPSSQLDSATTPQQVPSNGQFTPDESSVNPYLGDAGNANSQTSAEPVQPSFSHKPTEGNDSGSIPLGMRDLVKDYFSSLDKK